MGENAVTVARDPCHLVLASGSFCSVHLVLITQDLFQIYFKLPTAGRYNEPSVFHLVWQLFIVAKAKLFPPFPDLVSSFNLLICVLAFAFCHVPAAQRAVVLTDSEKLPTRTEDGSVDVLEVMPYKWAHEALSACLTFGSPLQAMCVLCSLLA